MNQYREYKRKYYIEHREQYLERAKKRYAEPEYRERQKKWRAEHLEQRRIYKRKYRKRKQNEIRVEIFHLLGDKCSNPNCAVPNGMKDIQCLQIDHIHGYGNKERKKYRNPLQYLGKILNKIKSGSKDYQLLCANCNWIKVYENNEV